MTVNLRALIGKLNHSTRAAVEGAAGLCLARTHYDVEIEHFLAKALDTTDGDVSSILRHFGGKVRGIKGEWTYETNLMKFNELTAGGKSAREAALGTWTGEQAAANGYRNVIVRSLEGKPGSYTKVDVLFVP